MGFFDKLLGSEKENKTTQTTKVDMPSWLDEAYKALISQAQGVAGTSGTLSPEELNAINLINQSVGKNYAGVADQAIGGTEDLLARIAGGFTAEDAEAGMNPYIQNVLDTQRREAQKSFYQGLEGLRDQEAAAGAFGGSRGAVAEENLRANYADQLDAIQSEGLYNAFENARNQYNLQNQLGLSGQTQLANLAASGQALDINSAAALQGAGALQRQVPQEALSFLQSIIAPAAGTYAGSTTEGTQTTSESGNWLGKIAGLATTGVGLFTGNPVLAAGGFKATGMNRGGLVTKYQDGGEVEMPSHIRNAPELSEMEKLIEWEKEKALRAAQLGDRAAANADWAAENVYNTAADPMAEDLLNRVLNSATVPSPKKKPSVLDKVTFRNSPEADTSWIMKRNPGLAEVVEALNSASPEELNAMFTMPEELLNKDVPEGYKFQSGGIIPRPKSMEQQYEEALQQQFERDAEVARLRALQTGEDIQNAVLNQWAENQAEVRAPINTTGKTRLEAALEVAKAIPRKAGAVAGNVAMTPAMAGIGIGSYLAEVPEEKAALSAIEEQFGQVPVREVGEVVTPKGARIPVEEYVRRPQAAASVPSSSTTTQKNESKAETKEEGWSPNIPLLMAGAAMMSGDDFFESLASGIQTYYGTKEQMSASEAAKLEAQRKAALEERGMLVDEAQVELAARKLAIEAKAAGQKGITKDKVQDDINNVFKVLMDASVGTTLPSAKGTDIRALADANMQTAIEYVTNSYSGQQAPTRVQLTPLQQMQELMAANPPRQ